MTSHGTVRFDHYASSPSGRILTPAPAAPVDGLAEDLRVFDRRIYSDEVHAPVPVLATGATLHARLPRCLDMPLRLAGTDSYNLPEEWEQLTGLLEAVIGIEHANNPHWQDYFTYLTVDCSEVRAAEQQRNSGLHVDGFQGARITSKTKTTRNYVATSNGGTRFYPQTFNAMLDDARYNIFEGFDLQAGSPLVAPENTVCFMDAYTVHESGIAARDGLRTFLRVTWDLKPFDRYGNTRNMMLDSHPGYQWDMVARAVHETLLTPSLDDLAAVTAAAV